MNDTTATLEGGADASTSASTVGEVSQTTGTLLSGDVDAGTTDAGNTETPTSNENPYASLIGPDGSFAKGWQGFVEALQRQMTGEDQDGDETLLNQFRERILDAPRAERQNMLRALTIAGADLGEGVEKDGISGWFQQAGESAARIISGMLTDTATAETWLARVPTSGATKTTISGAIDSPEKAREYVLERLDTLIRENERGQLSTFGPVWNMDRGEERDLTPEETKLIEAEQARAQRGINVAREMEQIAQSTDPLKSVTASTVGSSVALMGITAVPGGWMVGTVGYKNLNYDRLRLEHPDMAPSDAQTIAMMAAPVEAVLDRIGTSRAFLGLPLFKAALQGKVGKEIAKRALITGTVAYGRENAIEAVQDLTLSTAQELYSALAKDVEGPDWDREWDRWKETRGDVAIGMIPLTLLGVGIAGVRDVVGARAMLSDAATLEASGLDRSIAEDIVGKAASGDLKGAAGALRAAWLDRGNADQDAFDRLTANTNARIQGMAGLQQAGVLPGLRRTEDGSWALSHADGTLTPFATHAEADAALWEISDNQLLAVSEEIRAAVRQVSTRLEPGRELTFALRPEAMDSDMAQAEGMATQAGIDQRAESGDRLGKVGERSEPVDVAGEFSTAQSTVAAASPDVETAQAAQQILGSNQSDFVGGVQKSVITLFQRASPFTVFEEKLETDFAGFVEKRQLPYILSLLREYEVTFEDALMSPDVEADLASGNADQVKRAVAEMREAYSHLGVSFFVAKKSRTGKDVFTPEFRDISAKLMRTRLGGFIAAYGQFFRAVFKRAAKLRKLTRDGKMNPALERELARSLGLSEQHQENEAQLAEAERLATELRDTLGDTGFVETDDAPFSMLTPERLGNTLLEKIGEDALRVEQPRAKYDDKRQLIFDFAKSLAPDPAEGSARGDGSSLGAGQDLRRVGSLQVLKTRLASDVARDLRVNFIGETVATIEDFARLAQALRNPGFETFYLIGLKDAGGIKSEVVGAIAVTSRCPCSAALFEDGISDSDGFPQYRDFLKSVDATGFYLVHNHPSGDPSPSGADLWVTAKVARELGRDFQPEGHVVINHGEYAFIGMDPTGASGATIHRLDDIATTPDPLIARDWFMGMDAENPDRIAKAAARVHDASGNPDILTGLFLSARMTVVSMVQGRVEDFSTVKQDELAEHGRKVGASHLAVYGKFGTTQEAYAAIQKTKAQNAAGLIVDMVAEVGGDVFSAVETGVFPWNDKRFFGLEDSSKAERVQEGDETGFSAITPEQDDAPFSMLTGGGRGKPGSWSDVRPGDSWDSAKKHIPRTGEKRPSFGIKRGSWETMVDRLASWLDMARETTDPWGAKVRLDNPEKRGAFRDPLKNRAAHLMGSSIKDGTDSRELDREKVDWLGAIERTISDAQVRVTQGAETLYFRSYSEGTHQVVVENGAIKDQYALVTQYAPELRKSQFRGAKVEKIRPDPGLAPQGGPQSGGIPAQPQNQTDQLPTSGAQGNDAANDPESQPGFSAIPASTIQDAADFEARIVAKFDPFQRSPELRQKIGLEAQRRMIAAAREWRPLAAAMRSGADIQRERRQRIEDGINERMGAIDPGQLEALAIPGELLDPRDYPVFEKLLRQKTYTRKDGKTVKYWAGRLESPSAYKKRTGKDRAADEYDGMGDLPGWVFGGTLRPDEARDELGLESTNDLWDEIHKAINAAKLRTAERDAAQAELDRIEAEARDEADAWAARETARADNAEARRDALTGALRTLNGLIAALPPEIRGNIGGFVTISRKATPAAMLRELLDRVDKADVELEKWLRKDIDKQVRKLLDKAVPAKDEAGKKKVGKAGADVHSLFDEIRKAIKLDNDEAEALAAQWDTIAANPESTTEQEAHALLAANLVRLFGGWGDKYIDSGRADKNGRAIMVLDTPGANAARRAAALENATEIWTRGYSAWQGKLALEREQRQAIRDSLIFDAGERGAAGNRDRVTIKNNGFGGWMKKAFLNLLPFEGVARHVFGDLSVEAQALADRERIASNTYQDAMFVEMGRIDDLFAKMAGGKLAGQKLRWSLSQKDSAVGDRMLSQLEMLQAVLMWRQADGKRHMIGKLDEAGQPAGSWNYGDAFMAELELKLSSDARTVLGFITDGYAGEWATLNPIYKDLNGINLPQNANYAPITVAPIQSAGALATDPVTGLPTSGRSTTPGALLTRGTAIAEPEFRDALQTYVAHKKQMEYWKAYAHFNRDARAILGNREVTNAMTGKATDEATKILGLWLDDFAQGGNREAQQHLALAQGIGAMQNRFAALTLVGRISTVMLQSTQITAAMAEMPMGAYLPRLAKLFTGRLQWGDALASPYIQRRILQMPPVVQQAMEGLKANEPNAVKFAAQKLGLTLPGVDGLFTAGTFAIVRDYQISQFRKMGLPEAEAVRRADEVAQRVTDRVAQPTRRGARSIYENTASGTLRLVWAFASEARKNLGLMLIAGLQKDKVALGRAALYAILANGIMSQAIRNFWRDANDDEDDEWFDEKHWDPTRIALGIALDPLYGFPIIGEVIEAAIAKATGTYMPSGGAFDAVPRAVGALQRLDDYAAGDVELNDAMRDLKTVLSAMGLFNETLAGAASFSHILRDLTAIGGNIIGDDE